MRYISTLLVAGVLAATGPAMAQDLPDPDSPDYRELPLMIEETGTIYQKVIARTVQTKNGKTTDGSAETYSSLTYSYGEEGYTVVKKLINFKMLSSTTPGTTAPEAQEIMLKVAKSVGDITYLADESLSPVRIENWPEVLAKLKTLTTSIYTDNEDPEFTKFQGQMFDSLYGQLTAETASALLLPVDMFSTLPHNIGLEVNKPLIMDSQVMVPFANYPLDATESLNISSYDEATNTALVTYVYAPKPESLAALLTDFMPKILGQAGVEEDKAKGMVAEAKNTDPSKFIDLTTKCEYEMAIDTGLVRKGLCTKTTRITMSIESAKKIESWEFSESFTPFN